MRILAFSDLHCDLDQAARLTRLSTDADVVIGAGDFASVHRNLEETLDALSDITTPTVLVPGNNETEMALREAVAGWTAARVLHGESTEIGGQAFYGLGGGIPVTPWSWSFDLDEGEAEVKLRDCPEAAVLVVHSPPKGHCDSGPEGPHFGSSSILAAIEEKQPKLAVCGHIHEAWGQASTVGQTDVRNLGPSGTFIDL